MKCLTLLALFFSCNSFAMSSYTHCENIGLSKDYQQIELQLSKEGSLEMNSKFEMNLYSKDGDRVAIKGLNVQVQQITPVDSFVKTHYGFGGRSSTSTKVFAVKFHVSAEEGIGSEIQGCIPREINELNTYVICNESQTIMDRE